MDHYQEQHDQVPNLDDSDDTSPAFLHLRGSFCLPGQPGEISNEKPLRIHILHTIPIDNEHIIVHTDIAVTLYYLPTQTLLWTIACASFNFVFDRQQSLLVVTPDPPFAPLIVWDLKTGHIRYQLIYSDPDFDYVSPNGLALSPDGRFLAAGLETDEDSLVAFWDMSDGRLLGTLKTEVYYDFTSIAFHPSGEFLAIASINGSYVWLWSLSNGQLILEWETSKQDRVYDIAFNLDGTLLFASCASEGLHIWDMIHKREIPGPDTNNIHPSFITIIPHQSWLAVTHRAGMKKTIRIVEIGTWRIIHEFSGEKPSEACSLDGKILATSENDGKVYVWQLSSKRLLYFFI